VSRGAGGGRLNGPAARASTPAHVSAAARRRRGSPSLFWQRAAGPARGPSRGRGGALCTRLAVTAPPPTASHRIDGSTRRRSKPAPHRTPLHLSPRGLHAPPQAARTIEMAASAALSVGFLRGGEPFPRRGPSSGLPPAVSPGAPPRAHWIKCARAPRARVPPPRRRVPAGVSSLPRARRGVAVSADQKGFGGGNKKESFTGEPGPRGGGRRAPAPRPPPATGAPRTPRPRRPRRPRPPTRTHAPAPAGGDARDRAPAGGDAPPPPQRSSWRRSGPR